MTKLESLAIRFEPMDTAAHDLADAVDRLLDALPEWMPTQRREIDAVCNARDRVRGVFARAEVAA